MEDEDAMPLVSLIPLLNMNECKESVLTWSHISVDVAQPSTLFNRLRSEASKPQRQHLLDDISGIARPGEVLAIMGTSGVGKTTLLKVLSGQHDPQSTIGDVFVDGSLITRPQRLTGNIIGHVEQHELFVETMSLEEHLIFQAMLRMDRPISDDDRRRKVYSIVSLLALDKCLKTIIGRLSGGERKRLAFATVLLTDPSIILIDEPTSGLDSYLAKALMSMIRSMAVERRRTIVVVLHQPTSEMFLFIDSLCLLVHGGRLAFFGAKHDAETFIASECGILTSSLNNSIELLAAPPNGAEDTLDCGSQVADAFIKSSYAKALSGVISTLQESSDEAYIDVGVELCRSGFFRQMKWLLWRSRKAGARNPVRTINLLWRTVIPVIAFGIIYSNLQQSMHYAQNINALSIVTLSLTTNACIYFVLGTMPPEIRVSIKENHRRIYRISAYYISFVINNLPVFILMPFLFAAILYWLARINNSLVHFLSFIATVIITANAGAGIATMFSVLSSTVEGAIAMAVPLVQTLYILSGFFVSLKRIPSIFRPFQYISPIYYGYSILYELNWGFSSSYQAHHCYGTSINDSENARRELDIWCSKKIHEEKSTFQNQIIFNVAMLCILYIVFHIVAFFIIWARAQHTHFATLGWNTSKCRSYRMEHNNVSAI